MVPAAPGDVTAALVYGAAVDGFVVTRCRPATRTSPRCWSGPCRASWWTSRSDCPVWTSSGSTTAAPRPSSAGTWASWAPPGRRGRQPARHRPQRRPGRSRPPGAPSVRGGQGGWPAWPTGWPSTGWTGPACRSRSGSTTSAAGEAAATALLGRHPELTAVACTTDVRAGDARRGRAARDAGAAGVVGDRVRRRTRGAAASLTTVRQPMLEKGRVAGQLLLDEGERPAARHVPLPTTLVVRNSTGNPVSDR